MLLPQVEVVPEPMAAQVARLEALDADTTFHHYVAHAPGVASFYWGDFYQGLFYGGVVPVRTKEVGRLVLAVLSGCMTCRAGDIASARAQGLTEEQVEGVLRLDPASLPPAEQVVLELAQRLSPFVDEQVLTEDDWARLRAHFDDEQVSELLMCLAVLAGVGRMLTTTGFVPKVCEVPAG